MISVFRLLWMAAWLLSSQLLALPGQHQIEGLRRTRPQVVERELALDKGRPLEERVQRLKNLQIFSKVEAEETAEGKLRLRLEDKWTLIPIVKGGGGGGTAFYTLGLYDVNLLGRFIELGAQYENLGGISSGVAWFRDPRFLGQRLRLGIDLWHQARNLIYYGWGSTVLGGATLMRNKANVSLEKEWLPWLSAGLGWELNQDSLGDGALGDHLRAANIASGTRPEGRSTASIARLNGTMGRLNWDTWLVQGQSLDLIFERSSLSLGADSEFSRGTADFRIFRRVGGHNVGLRAAGAWSDASFVGQHAFLGGLDGVRGFVHGRFMGRVWWLANLEWRAPLYSSESVVFQGVGFWDAARAAADWEGLSAGGDGGQGAGAGLRLILPKIYRLNLRADFGWAMDGSERGLSFGLQQFF